MNFWSKQIIPGNHFLWFLMLLLSWLAPATSIGQPVPDTLGMHHWVDSVYTALSTEQRIGQLLMVRANSNADSSEIKQLELQIRLYNLGGLCFFKGGPVRQAILTNYYQKIASTPLFIAMDAEWGPGMRLDSVVQFPRQMTLSAMRDETLITDFGSEVARQLKRLGVQISFSPVADINSNAANPVINIRSFGQEKEDVARKAILYMQALQHGGMMTVAKHFPGHGDTDTDSHYALPLIRHSLEQIENVDLYPFRRLIDAGVDGIMVAHLNIPALEQTSRLPSSLSKDIVTDLLCNKLKFTGLIFTDALDMKGVANYDNNGNVELKALLAGNDILLLPSSVENTVKTIKTAVDSGIVSRDILAMHCKKILEAKYKAGLSKLKPVELKKLYTDLHTSGAASLSLRLYENAITVLKNDEQILPVKTDNNNRIASLTIGYDKALLLQNRMDNYAEVTHFTLPRNPEAKAVSEVMASLKVFNTLIISINNTISTPSRNFGISDAAVKLIDTLLQSRTCVLNLFTIPYCLQLFKSIDKANAVVIAYQDNADAYDAVVQMEFGANAASGKIPVDASVAFPVASGLTTNVSGRLRYNSFEDSEIGEDAYSQIDSIALEGIRKKAYPGCQVLIAKNGNVCYNKSFGNTDYIHNLPVTNSSIYDLASVTKAATTTLAMMKLYDEGRYKLDDHLSATLTYLAKSNKRRISFREVLTHQAGLAAWIPFYKNTIKDERPDSSIYRHAPDSLFNVRVAEGLYIRKDYFDMILDSIVHSPLSERKTYKYSDLGFILLQQYIEKVTGMSLDQYVDQNFYKPLGLSTMTFKPLTRFPKERIVPTENDTVFRHQVIQGDVHDPAAAMMGGVAGHAGLFSTANDLAVVFQMLLQNGYYGGRQFIDSATVRLFTSRQITGNRRGLGFDKPQLRRFDEGPACPDAPASSFGHTGFTGTYAWADPENDLLIVFLSNRVNPDAEVNKLVQLGTRTRIQQLLYDALEKSSHTGEPWKKGAIDIPHK